MKFNIMAVVRYLQDRSFIYSKLNTAFLTLIPKVATPKSIKEQHPISLLQGVYKLNESSSGEVRKGYAQFDLWTPGRNGQTTRDHCQKNIFARHLTVSARAT